MLYESGILALLFQFSIFFVQNIAELFQKEDLRQTKLQKIFSNFIIR